MGIEETRQSLSPGQKIELFEVDLNPIGVAEIHRFTPHQQILTFDGNAYQPIEVRAEDFEWSGTGPLPQPTIMMGNINLVFSSLVREHNDLVGAKVTRIRTFRQFLDDGSSPDPEAKMPIDVYTIDAKEEQTKFMVKFRLKAAMDQQGRALPGRQIVRDACLHRYRVWNGSTFDYTKATCPYADATYFTEQGNPVSDPALDRCGKRLSDCEKRFGVTVSLPIRSFPGVARLRR